jgi:hypothetical protein
MKNRVAANIPLAIVFSAAVAALALWAAARRPEPHGVPATEPASVMVMADESQPRPSETTGTNDGAGREMTRTPTLPGRPASAVEQIQHIFHELHANERNTLCAVCDSHYGSA